MATGVSHKQGVPLRGLVQWPWVSGPCVRPSEYAPRSEVDLCLLWLPGQAPSQWMGLFSAGHPQRGTRAWLAEACLDTAALPDASALN